MGPELSLDELAAYPRDSLGYTFAKIMKHLGYAAHFYSDRPSIDEETDYVTMRVRKTHDLQHVVSGFSMIGPGALGLERGGAGEASHGRAVGGRPRQAARRLAKGAQHRARPPRQEQLARGPEGPGALASSRNCGAMRAVQAAAARAASWVAAEARLPQMWHQLPVSLPSDGRLSR